MAQHPVKRSKPPLKLLYILEPGRAHSVVASLPAGAGSCRLLPAAACCCLMLPVGFCRLLLAAVEM